MATTHYYWLWSLAVLFIIRVGPSGSSPSMLRSDGAVADPLSEFKLSSWSQRLDKLKMGTHRHASALNRITDDSAWRNRRLLSTIQPIESHSKSLTNTLLVPRDLADSQVRISANTKERATNYLVKYLRSLDHAAWVSKCLKGGKCSMTHLENEATEEQASEEQGSIGDSTNVSSNGSMKTVTPKSTNDQNSTVDSMSEIFKLANKTILVHVPPKKNEIVPDLHYKNNGTESHPIIDLLLSSSYDPLNNFESDTSRRPKIDDSSMIDGKNYTSLINTPSVTHNKSKVLVNSGVPSNGENTNKQIIEYTEDFSNRTIPVNIEGTIDLEPVSFSSLIDMDESSSSPMENDSLADDQKSIPIKLLGYLPSNNRLIHYNNHVLPLTIQFTPTTYVQRYPRGGLVSGDDGIVKSSAIENAFPPYTEVQTQRVGQPTQTLLPSEDSGVTCGRSYETESLDSLVSTYRNEIFRRVSAGKRESEFSNSKKKTVTTSCPGVPRSYTSPSTSDGQIFARVAPGDNGSDSNIKLFVDGNWVANSKDNSRCFYIEPQSRQFTRHQPFSEAKANGFDSQQLSHQLPSSTNPTYPNCPSNRNLPYPSQVNRLPLYSQQSYAVNEKNIEQNVPSSIYSARAASEIKVPSTVAARNGYSWYDYGSITNDVNSKLMNGPFSGGPVAFPKTWGFGIIPDENSKGVFRRRMDNLNYEDSLVNFPPQKYEPPVVGSHDISALKPEELMEHDIDTSDMLFVGTQLLATLPLAPSEHHADYSNDPAYGNVVADVSSRSSPVIKNSLHEDPAFTAFTNTVFKTHDMLDSPRVQPSNYPDFNQAPYTYFPSYWPNEFVSGQWVKRKPVSDVSAKEFIYDQLGQRRITDAVQGWQRINPIYNNHPSLPM